MLKYIKIAEELTADIQKGKLVAGEKLPSIRRLAETYACSKQTIVEALKKMEYQHLVYSKPKSGYYVVAKKFEAGLSTSETFDFATSAPDWNHFPYHDFQHCINQAIDSYQKELFIYGTPSGLPALIETLKVYLMDTQIFAKSENISITSGVQQALNLLCQMPFPNGKSTILIEEPSYSLFIHLLKLYGLPVQGIKRNQKGIDFLELERLFKEEAIKFFYTMPRYHNPLGTSYTKKEKIKMVQLANKYDVFIVEDDYLADFEQDKKNDALFTYDSHHRTIYLKSFSKIMFPGLRIGVAVLPPELTQLFNEYKTSSDIDSSMFSQGALEIYLKSGMYTHHLEHVKGAYFRKASLFKQAVAQHPMASRVDFRPPLAMKTHFLLPREVHIDSLIQALGKKSVLLKSSDSNYLTLPAKERDNLLMIDLSTIQETKIKEGVHLLMDEIQKQIETKGRFGHKK